MILAHAKAPKRLPLGTPRTSCVLRMTYFSFHLIFVLPALVLALVLAWRRLRLPHLLWGAVVAAIAFVTTTPWDNWAVKKGIWSFDWARTTPVVLQAFGQEWRLPAEEYAFFILLTFVVSLLCVYFLPKPREARPTKSL